MITQEIIQRLLQSRKDRIELKERKCIQKTKENSEHLLGTEYFGFPKFICCDPNSRCDCTRRRGIREVVRHEDGALVNGTSALIKETLEGSLTPSTTEGQSKKVAVDNPESRLSLDNESSRALILHFPA